jgi:glutamyl-tRNA reductase
LILNTCNRIEVAAIAKHSRCLERTIARILGFDELKKNQFYSKHGFDAFSHVCHVASGLFSQTPGEYHIVSQIKNAITHAEARGLSSTMIQRWFSSALHVSRHIRGHADGLPKHKCEIEDTCIAWLKANEPQLLRLPVVVVGAGMVGEAVVGKLQKESCKVLWVWRNNKPQIPLSGKHAIKLCKSDTLPNILHDAGVLICAAETKHPIIKHGMAAFFNTHRKTAILDLGVPRNVDVRLNGACAHVEINDLDRLKQWQNSQRIDVKGALASASQIVEAHREMYVKIIHDFQGGNESKQAL